MREYKAGRMDKGRGVYKTVRHRRKEARMSGDVIAGTDNDRTGAV